MRCRAGDAGGCDDMLWPFGVSPRSLTSASAMPLVSSWMSFGASSTGTRVAPTHTSPSQLLTMKPGSSGCQVMRRYLPSLRTSSTKTRRAKSEDSAIASL